MLLAWLRTVLTDRLSWRAISMFSLPSAIRPRIDPLPVGELGEDVGRGSRPGRPEVAHHPVGDPRAEDHLARADRLDGPDDLAAAGSLEQVAARPGAHGREDGVLVLHHREHQHADVRRRPHDLLGGLDPVEPRHLEVHEDDVRLEVQGHGDGGAAVRRVATTSIEGAAESSASTPRRNSSWSSTTSTRSGSIAQSSPSSAAIGSTASTVVPEPGPDVTVQVPPTSSARSLMENRPTPGA